MMRFFTYAYAILADLALASLLIFGGGLGLLFAGPWWTTAMAIASLCFIVYANFLMATGRRFTRLEATVAIVVGGGLPLIAVAVAVLLMVLIGVDFL
jgi:hypothetical protein